MSGRPLGRLERELDELVELLVSTFGVAYMDAGTELEEALENLHHTMAKFERLRLTVLEAHELAQHLDPCAGGRSDETSGQPPLLLAPLRAGRSAVVSSPNPLLATAVEFYTAGLMPLPTRTDGSKAPAVAWQKYQEARPDIGVIIDWFSSGKTDGIGTLTGAVSGNLEMLEWEGRAFDAGMLEVFRQDLVEHGADELWERLQGWAEMTPGGGIHFNFRVTDSPARRNTKLASTADNTVLIETRGEGGFTVNAPSGGRTHPTGKPWLTISGGPATMGQFTGAERDMLHMIAALRDEEQAWNTGEDGGGRAGRSVRLGNELLPGDDYAAKVSWAQILEPLGWRARPERGFTGWIRPGKTAPGNSATTGLNEADNLYVFSTNTVFQARKYYDKFGAFALLEHQGNIGAAASALRQAGYGHGATAPTPAFTPPPAPVVRRLSSVPDLPVDPDEPAPEPAKAPKTYEPFEMSMADLLVDTYRDVIRYCPQRRKWLSWAEHYWGWDDSGAVWRHIGTLARTLPDGGDWKPFKKRAMSAAGVRAIAELAQVHLDVLVQIHELDARPFELNTPGGIIDLRTGQLRPSDPEALHTRMTSCTPDASVDPSVWLGFLAETFQGNTEVIPFLQRLMGYTASGVVGEHILPFCQGGGGNGKGVFLETCMKIFGDYATSAPAGFLVKQFFAKHETEIARLQGARMVLCSEVNEGDAFDEAKVKLMTGGDTLTGRFMRADFFSFVPSHTMWLMANTRPAVASGGRAFWRRLRLVLFEHDVVNEIADLQGILAGEHGPAVLAWIVAGAVQYFEQGLAEPQSVLVATKAYESDQDTVAHFLAEECAIGGGANVQVTVPIVRAAYEQWCAQAGEEPVNAKRLTMELARNGVIVGVRNTKVRLYGNIALNRTGFGDSWRIGTLS